MRKENGIKICLVGNQNSGKTTLFNTLTGMNQKVGNWPGVTIEKRTGIIKNTNYELVDLPGIYSLIPYTEEEKVSSSYILEEKPDIIINIVDATCLERSLYLTTQLLELNTNVIVALNMADVLSKKGISINTQSLQDELRTPVCKISALKQTGIENIINYIIEMQDFTNIKAGTSKKIFENTLGCAGCNGCVTQYKYNKTTKSTYSQEQLEQEITKRYNYISKIVKKCTKKKIRWVNTSQILDKFFLSKIFAIPIFIFIMFSIYFLSVGVVGKYTGDTIMELIKKSSAMMLSSLQKLSFPEWTQSLIIDGVVQGIASVLSFLPQLAILFLCISILETTGYMSRVAFLLDSSFRKIGLNGKALIPFIIGSGCSVPGIMSTKIMENSDERKMTSILVPFIPCSAKLPIIALFSGTFFKENAGFISFSLYVLAVIIIIISSILMKNFIFTNTEGAFIIELPDYRFPNIKYVLRDVVEKTLSFIKRAGTTILIASIVIWFLLSFSSKLEYGVNVEDSILALIGKKISWIFYPIIGVKSWEASVSAIQGLIAKEQVISSMAIISGFKETSLNQGIFAQGMAFDFFSQASAYAYVVFNLFSAPCCAAIATMRRELAGFRKMLYAILYQTTVAWILSTLIYQISLLLF